MKNKNKTAAAWLAFLLGPLGLHRFYLHGLGDRLGWLHWLPTALGMWGLLRVQRYGQDDHAAWVLVPCLGFVMAACAITAIYFGLMAPEKWQQIYNPQRNASSAAAPTPTPTDAEADSTLLPSSSRTNWLTMGAVIGALLFGSIALMSSIVFSFQRFFEYQVEEAQKISQWPQPPPVSEAPKPALNPASSPVSNPSSKIP